MTRALVLTCCGVLLAFVPARVAAAQTSKPIMASEPVTVTATIEAIDKATRTVTLKGPKGNSIEVKAPEAMQGFDRLKVGDQVSATYFEAIAAHVRRPGDPAPSADPMTTTMRKDRAPGSETRRQQTISVSVQALDPAVPSVTVKGPSGRALTLRVQDPKVLQNVKVGDTVDVTYFESLLVKVDHAVKKD